jgi:hypothetical protein
MLSISAMIDARSMTPRSSNYGMGNMNRRIFVAMERRAKQPPTFWPSPIIKYKRG